MSYSKLPYDAFLRITRQNKGLEYVLLLGAGASVSSGVQSANDCIWEWKKEIYLSNNRGSTNSFNDMESDKARALVQEWIDDTGSYPSKDDPTEYSYYAEKAYPTIESRRKYFENLFEGKTPSLGYVILCLLAKEGMTKIVFTTNFDSLITRAAYLNGLTPIEVTIDNENLISRQLSTNQMMCVALHGDYKYEKLKNTGTELDNQSEEFISALQFHLYNKHLIVLGYSGRDRSLMDAIEKAYSAKGSGQLFWCSYKDHVSKDVELLLNKVSENNRKAYLVPTDGFDNTIRDIAEYCFSENTEMHKKINDIAQIRPVSEPNEEIQVKADQAVTSVTTIDAPSTRHLISSDTVYLTDLILPNFIGAWDESSESDKEIISSLSRQRYIDWIVNIREVLHQDKGPLKFENGVWAVCSRKDLWNTLGTRIFDSYLDQFRACAVDVLSEIDPAFELPREERYAASIYDKVLRHSKHLRNGIADTLALLGNHADVLTNCTSYQPQNIASRVVHELLDNASWEAWGSLNDLLPTLAEAAPREFLRSVESALQKSPSPFVELFAQEGNGVTGRNYLTGMLWALEGLAWHEDYVAHVSVILAELASHDPGGNWANRPSNSLTTILLPWFPQTFASIEKRIASITAIRTDFPNIAWKLLLSLLPNQHQTTSGTYKPRWSFDFPKGWKPTVTNEDYWTQVTAYAELAVQMAQEDTGRLRELVDGLDHLPRPSFDSVLEYLSRNEVIELPEETRLPIWTSLTTFALKHRRFSEAKWALDGKTISRVEIAANKLAPNSLEGLYHSLFSNRDFDLYEENGNWEEQRNKLDERRKRAIEEILTTSGLEGVLRFLDTIESSHLVGWALGAIASNEIDIELLPNYLDDEDEKHRKFIDSYVGMRHHQHGWKWVDDLDRTSWTSKQNCQFLMSLPFETGTWNRAANWLQDSEPLYWQQVAVNPYLSSGDILLAIDKLLDVSRPNAAIECLYYRLHEKLPFENKKTVRALLDAVSEKEGTKGIDYYHVTQLIKALQDDPTTEKDDLFNVEWAYLALLDRYGDNGEPKFLQQKLATQPEFFCEVIRLIYRSDKESEPKEEPDESMKAIANNAWRLLNEWRRPPGLQEDGSISSEEFDAWLTDVKKQCRDSGHLEVAMINVGEVLFYCPSEPEGLWISKVAAAALNNRDAQDMRSGFRTEAINSRGVHWVDPTGKPELELAAEWRKKADAVDSAGFARFAATLRDLAISYEHEAEQVIESNKGVPRLDEDKSEDGDVE